MRGIFRLTFWIFIAINAINVIIDVFGWLCLSLALSVIKRRIL